jgi:photosystem II stability/assembly factor-like uncharacterized protein
MRYPCTVFAFLLLILSSPSLPAQSSKDNASESYEALKWRNIGPYRGGRSNAVCGVQGDPMTYYFGSTGGGVWKTTDAGLNWKNCSDGFFNTGSVGAIEVAPSDPNVLYVGMGEHAVRGVMTSHGDGVYKSEDAGRTWKHLGLPNSRHIAEIRIHPQNPDVVWVAVQGAVHGPSEERGVYKTTDGGQSWEQVLYVNASTGAADLSIDPSNPRILYAAMWEHRRYPWTVLSGGEGSGLYKSVDGGISWEKLEKGLPENMGKAAIDVSPANPMRIFANIEAEKGGVYRSDDGGQSWKQVCSDRVTIARAWYYIEVFADPQDAETVYVLNAPVLRSVDGGKTFQSVPNPHSDQHDLWINPDQPDNMILANDGGACVTFNGGKSWSTQQNQPTAQFYRVITDRRFPYHVYGGQQDNSTMAIASRSWGSGIDRQDWYPVAGGESAFLAFDPDDPQRIYGGSYQGNISAYDARTGINKDIMAYPVTGLGTTPKDMKYRFNWNAPIVAQPQNPSIIYHGANVVLKTTDGGMNWVEISPDLTRDEPEKQGPGGSPYTNEAAGGENYNTISYLACSPLSSGEIWVGSDDGLVHLTTNEGNDWKNITPPDLGVAIINSIEVSFHQKGRAYIVATRYKMNDFTPMIYVTDDYGKNWSKKTSGIDLEAFVRVVREDRKDPNLLYAGTETGFYISFDRGDQWHPFQSNLPVCPINDLTIQDNDLVVATSGRGFWILDDISAIQQSKGEIPTDEVQLFSPKTAIKFYLDAPKTAPARQGQNPLNGVILDYVIPEGRDTLETTLEILNSAGEVIRTYSNQKEKGYQSFPGGPPSLQVLPSKAGLNRFNWDLRTDRLPYIPKIFVLGDYRGHSVAPGNYSARLINQQDTLTTQIEVAPDPRLKASKKDFQDQEIFLASIDEMVREIHTSVKQLRTVRDDLQQLLDRLENQPQADTLLRKGKEIVEQINTFEQKLVQPQQETFQDVINFTNQLNSELLTLKGRVDSHAPRLTRGARQRLLDLQENWTDFYEEEQQALQMEIDAFNQLFKSLELPVLVIPN